MTATPSPSSWSGAFPMQSRKPCRLGAAFPAAPSTGPPGRPTAPAGCAAAPPGPGGTARTWRPWQPGLHERRGRSKRPWRCSPGSQGSSPRVPGASPVSGLQLQSWCPLWELSERKKRGLQPNLLHNIINSRSKLEWTIHQMDCFEKPEPLPSSRVLNADLLFQEENRNSRLYNGQQVWADHLWGWPRQRAFQGSPTVLIVSGSSKWEYSNYG